jgi:hypothetical protein
MLSVDSLRGLFPPLRYMGGGQTEKRSLSTWNTYEAGLWNKYGIIWNLPTEFVSAVNSEEPLIIYDNSSRTHRTNL